uniref:Uncharacterized protein n=1 Tax=Arundo donax TaxID=35708 RepID=A0A0A9F253_ARUDO
MIIRGKRCMRKTTVKVDKRLFDLTELSQL